MVWFHLFYCNFSELSIHEKRTAFLLLQVTEALAQAGHESTIIVGIDFTKSNEWTGYYNLRTTSLFIYCLIAVWCNALPPWCQCDMFHLSGKFSFHGRSLHHITNTPTPYEQAISIIGQTLSKFDDDNLIPCFGFGDGKDYTHYRTCLLHYFCFSKF